jgi:hypothetical protein
MERGEKTEDGEFQISNNKSKARRIKFENRKEVLILSFVFFVS